MRYDVFMTETFRKNLKKLKKKYRQIKDDVAPLIRRLEADPSVGDPIPGWDREIWKIRMASSGMKIGKRGGFRDPPSPLKNWSGRWRRVIWHCIPRRYES